MFRLLTLALFVQIVQILKNWKFQFLSDDPWRGGARTDDGSIDHERCTDQLVLIEFP